MADCLYLRKSRMDTDLESQGVTDTLLRHEQTLLRHAQALGRSVTQIYREVVSGETISTRPEMQRLLRDVESGLWDAVHVMEIERLARGDTLDQGLVAQSFLYSNTKIITPQKTYDPGNEFDEEYFEFGLFMSRREYKTINRRQQRGRLASVHEGKWVANRAPYGYRRRKLDDQKGWTLEPLEPEASVVQDIFRWITEGCPDTQGVVFPLGTVGIAQRLNRFAIPSPNGGEWQAAVLRELVRNPAYAGWVRWGYRAQKKTLSDGHILLSRPRSSDEESCCVRGLHPPLVSDACFAQAQMCLQRRSVHNAPPGKTALQNPLAGLVFCSVCGRPMTRRPYADGRPATLLCPTPHCSTMASALSLVETAILSALSEHLLHISLPLQREEQHAEMEALQRTLAHTERELKKGKRQLDRIHSLLEEGVYDAEAFVTRRTYLKEQQDTLEKACTQAHTDLSAYLRYVERSAQGHSTPQHILDVYPFCCQTASEKNALLRSCLERVEYHKTSGGRYQNSDLCLYLHPRV